MTNEVAALVLRNNYLQSQAISTLELQSAARLPEYQHLIRLLERSGELNRTLEFLPTDEELAERRKSGVGLTRPELAILLAYSKIWLNTHLLASDVPEDPYLSAELARYFPAPIQERFPRAIGHHRLRREIIATATTNSLVNRMGPTFVTRAQEDTGAEPRRRSPAPTPRRARSSPCAKCGTRIEALDNKVTANLQYEAAFQTSRLLRHVTYWLLAERSAAAGRCRGGGVPRRRAPPGGGDSPGAHRRGAAALRGKPQAFRRRRPAAGARGADRQPRGAERRARHRARSRAHTRVSVAETARVYFEVGTRIGFDWLRARIEKLKVEGPWQAIARSGLRDAALRVHRRLTERVLSRKMRGSAEARVTAWVEAAGKDLAHWQRTLDGHARRRRRRLRHAHGGRRVGPQARQLNRCPCPRGNHAPGKLILVRHGQSTWNVENLFTGWTDVDLSELGRGEAAQAGREVLRERLAVDIAFTSVLEARHPHAVDHAR